MTTRKTAGVDRLRLRANASPVKFVPFPQLASYLLGVLLLGACRESPPIAPPQPTEVNGPLPVVESSQDVSSPSGGAPSVSEEETPRVENTAKQKTAPTTFPPRDFEPPFAKSAAPGDGQWGAFGPDTGEMVQTTVHPHEVSRFLSVEVVALNLARLQVHYMPGSDDIGDVRLPEPLEAGRIPKAHYEGLLAAFNGGFMPQHGRWGMKKAGVEIVPPRASGCTVALSEVPLASGRFVHIAPWSALKAHDASLSSYRQTPPCLLDDGRLHPDLERGHEKPWGGFLPNLVTRRRSAVGLDKEGGTLFYAVGIEVGPRLLAEGLRYAGATYAAELDINDNWTRFALFEHDEASGEPRVFAMLRSDMVKQKSGYVARASARDFFYVRRR